MACKHRFRLSQKDKDFLRTNRITPYDCSVCEKIAEVEKRREKKPKLHLENEDDGA